MTAMYQCKECLNLFVQPFVCTSCGAEKLYGATVRGQAMQIERLRTLLSELLAVVRGECPSLLDEDSDGFGDLAIRIDAALGEKP